MGVLLVQPVAKRNAAIYPCRSLSVAHQASHESRVVHTICLK